MLLLTNSFKMGDADPDYTHVRIRRAEFDLENKNVRLEIVLGYKEGDDFHASIPIPRKTRRSVELSGAAYQDFMTNVMTGVGTKLYQYLVDEGHYEGTVE